MSMATAVTMPIPHDSPEVHGYRSSHPIFDGESQASTRCDEESCAANRCIAIVSQTGLQRNSRRSSGWPSRLRVIADVLRMVFMAAWKEKIYIPFAIAVVGGTAAMIIGGHLT